MKKTFITALALIGAYTASMADDYKGSLPTSGGTYYLYNVGAKQFLGTNDGRLVLGGERVEVTLESIKDTKTPGFFRISSGDEQWGADLFGTPMTTGGKYGEWRIEPIVGGGGACAVASRNSEASASLYLYDSSITGSVSATTQMPSGDFKEAQWLLVSTVAEVPVYSFRESDDTYKAGEDGTAEVRLYRQFNLDAWNMFCSPVDISAEQIVEQFGEDARVAELAAINGTDAHFTSVTGIKAGTPCIVYVTKEASFDFVGHTGECYTFSGEMAFASQAQSVTIEGATFYGTLAKGNPTTNSYVFDEDGKLVPTYYNSTVNALSAYLAADAGVELTTWTLDEETAIGSVSTDASGRHDVFTPAGEKVKSNATDTDGLKRGVYIMGGKKKIK